MITPAYQQTILEMANKGVSIQKSAGEYVFAPGEEMQHDTSPHNILLGGRKIKAQCAALVLATVGGFMPNISLFHPF